MTRHLSSSPPPPSPAAHPSALALERYLVGELPPAPAAALAEHAAGCPRCQARLVELRAEGARFAAGPERAAEVDALVRATGGPRRRWRSWGAGAALAAAAALALALWLPRQRPGEPAGAFDGRPKGGLGLEVIRRSAGGQLEWISPGQRLSPGDAIRFRLRTPVAGHVAVLGLDAAQMVTPYAPAGAVLEPLAAGAPVVLDGSIVLDATLGPERLIAIVCPAPLPVAELVAQGQRALAAAGGDPRAVARVTSACREATLLIEKVAP